MGRPCGEQRAALLLALDQGPGTSRELARRAGLKDLRSVTKTLDNMAYRGVPQVQVLRCERVPGRNRPVPVYGRLHSDARVTAQSSLLETFSQLGLALFGGGQAEVPA